MGAFPVSVLTLVVFLSLFSSRSNHGMDSFWLCILQSPLHRTRTAPASSPSPFFMSMAFGILFIRIVNIQTQIIYQNVTQKTLVRMSLVFEFKKVVSKCKVNDMRKSYGIPFTWWKGQKKMPSGQSCCRWKCPRVECMFKTNMV